MAYPLVPVRTGVEGVSGMSDVADDPHRRGPDRAGRERRRARARLGRGGGLSFSYQGAGHTLLVAVATAVAVDEGDANLQAVFGIPPAAVPAIGSAS